ncbi:MAG: hypothetical protein CBC34_010275 [Hyphomicrobiaceae bacterium TMED74]|nr:hypothetical protein [Filomicrobium sp.]RPG41361.1 MAG: hypothetical protein CBC34_010275 [Hyphomicrobiaceae bacterium TMED74]
MALVKGIIITVVLLFTGNFALQEYIRLSAKHDVIVDAFREHAIAACRQNSNEKLRNAAWNQASQVRLSIGKSDLNVYLWQTNHRLWKARYSNAYLYITINDDKAHMHCEYDISSDMAWVYQLGKDQPQQQPYQTSQVVK